MEKDILELNDFIDSCNDFIDGKFILADIKISKILKSISNSSKLYDLIAECMINYDFQKEFSLSTINSKNTSFTLPKEQHKLIPFVFCLLVEIDSKRINFNEFLSSQFPIAQNQCEQYEAFAKNVIIPFRNVVADIFEIDKNSKKENNDQIQNNIIDKKIAERLMVENIPYKIQTEEVLFEESPSVVDAVLQAQIQEDEEINLLFDRIVRLTSILEDKLMFVRNPLKKSNIGLIIDGLYEACSLKNVKIIIALVMALNSLAFSERNMRPEIKELNTICYDFYEQ